jgi:hypothetical protein
MSNLYKVRLIGKGRVAYEGVYYVVAENSNTAKHDAINCFMLDTEGEYPDGYYIESRIRPYGDNKGIWKDFLWKNVRAEETNKELHRIFKHG